MIEQYLHWMGFGLCHQLPARSFFGGGFQVPVCARDTGIYVGFVVSLVVVALLHRHERPRGFARTQVWLTMAVFLLLMAWDGLTSYAGLRTTDNGIRLLTGLGVGFSAAVVVFPMLQDELWARATPGRVLDPTWRFVVWLVSIAATSGVVWWVAPLFGVAYPLLVSLCIVITLTSVNLVIVAMLPAFDRRASTLADLAAPIAIAVLLSFAEIALAGQMRVVLEGVARSL